ncbi:hypothetical protein AYK24_09875 [Thermoplasmatales archaeon SG8-52-4]|nr:MAG: hypothetical protein AYK24_09875 [Thermoplasmatales archaeon SG8-52-4]
MPYTYELPNMTEGIDEALVDTVSAVPVFTPLLLLFIFLIVLIGGAVKQKFRTGTADVPMWMTLASIVTLIISLILTLRSGLIQGEVVAIVIAMTILSGAWLFFDRNRNEI